ncbi:hypothetical protein NP493_369g01022 [Ridgeia piscesae]|uniref:Apple domain-containing protein n=1 Tax=Ridgeia piscesae TaxID=27915 RepID=A0AAD9NVZ1_RIDPI|nr:hypothetical protein NP493_369g01022 [Ridgeia piscesae]
MWSGYSSDCDDYSSDCDDYSYGDSWTLKEIVSLATTSRVTCASLCMQTAECRGYSLHAGVCRLLRVEEAMGGLVGCESRTNFPGTTYLVSVVHNERSEKLGQCPYFSEWKPTGRDDGEGEWRAGRCVCPNGKRGVFCNFGKEHSGTGHQLSGESGLSFAVSLSP